MARRTAIPPGQRGSERTLVNRYLYRVRDRFHPLDQLRRHTLSRALLRALDLQIWVKLPGMRWTARMRLVRPASFFVLYGIVDPGIFALICTIGRQFGIRSFWDIGANVGYYSWLVKGIAPEAEIRMFEPDLDNLDLVRQTIRRASLRGVTVREFAVSDARDVRCFALDEISGATGGIIETCIDFSKRQWRVASRTIMVNTVTLDEERHATGAVDLIKMDVEGHEEAVIRGGR